MQLTLGKGPKRTATAAEVKVSSESWLTKQHPRSLEDVKMGVHWSYENRVREWLIRACRAHAEQAETRDFRPHVLALCGPSGCGKSTLVEVLCKELDFDIVVWHDDMWEFQSSGGGGAREIGGVGFEGRGGQGGRDWERGTARLSLEERRTKTEEMESFVLQSKYPKLMLHRGTVSAGASAGGPAGSASGGSAASNVVHASKSKSRNSDSFLPAFRRIILIHDPPNLLADQAHGQSHASSHYAKQQQRLGELLTSFSDPVVLIVSDVGGKDDVMYAKKRCLPASVQNLVKLEDIYQAGSTPKNLLKVLSAILAKEKLHDVPNSLLEGIAESSGGDIRHAVLQLEYVVRSFGSGGETSFAKSSLCASVIGGYEDGAGADGQGGGGMSSSGHSGAGSKRKGAPGIKLPNPSDSHPRVQLVRGEDSDGALLDMTAAAATATAGSHSQESGGGGVGKPRIERRDARYSSLTSAGKLVRAALDGQGQLAFDIDQVVYKSELEPELLIPFVQFNVIKSLELTAALESRCHAPLAKVMGSDADGCEPKSSATDPWGSQTVSGEDSSSSKRQALESTNGSQLSASASSFVPADVGQRIEPMQQVSSALAVCSDIEAMLGVKYDPSALIDRASTIFPGEYACCLLARAGCVARGVGAADRIAAAKALGHKGTFNPIFRPKVFDLPRQRARVEASLSELQAHLLLCTAGGRDREENGSLPSSLTAIMMAPRVYPTSELSTTLEPYLQMHRPPHGGTKWPNATTSTITSAMLRSLDALRQLRRASNGDDSEYTIPPMASEAAEQVAHTTAPDADQELEQQQYARSNSKATSQQVSREAAANEGIEDVEDIDDPDGF